MKTKEPETPDSIRLVTADWVAGYLDVTKARVYELCREGHLQHVKLGRRYRFSPRKVIAWAEAGGYALPGGWRRELVR